ncbi:hypothetical protein NDA13_004809 [Ustilago tritici]|nr:hypothetical protein NDA13_004809 [Ustilago tritici]
MPSSSTPGSKPGAKPSRPGRTTTNPPPVKICMRFNSNWGCSGCNRPHICANCYEKHPVQSCGAGNRFKAMSTATTGSGLAVTMLPASSPTGFGLVDTLLAVSSSSGFGLADTLRPASSSLGSGLIGRMFPVASLGSGLVDRKISATHPSTPCASSASRALLVPSLEFFAPQGITDMSSDSAATLLVLLLTGSAPPARPNTTCKLPIIDCSDTPATVGSLKLEHRAPFLDLHPDQDFANQLRGALRHGALLGYSGPLFNDGIHHSFVSIHYKNLDTVIDFVCKHQGTSLWKADLKDTFRHVIVAAGVARLMGIHFDRLPIQVLSIAAAALGFHLSRRKMVWSTTRLEILGIELDSVAQTASITDQRRQQILQLCKCIVNQGCASLLNLQQVAGHLQFVTRVAPHGCAFLRRIYDAVKSHHRAPFGRRISKATRDELMWWTSTLQGWDGLSLLQPSPLVVEHVWTDASRCSIGSHCGHMEHPTAVFSRVPLSFLPPLIQWRNGITNPPSSFVAATKLSKRAAFLLWNGLAPTTRSRSTKICSDFATFISTMFRFPQPFPVTVSALIKWAAHYHAHVKTHHMVQCSIAALRSWHIDLGLSTPAFSSDHLARAIWGFKRSAGNPAPTAKLPITLPLLSQLVNSLPSICHSRHNCCMFCAAFCLAFACLLCSSKFTWEMASSPPLLTIGSIKFTEDGSYATVLLPSSKTDPFGTGVTLTAPAVPLTTCVVKALKVICQNRSAPKPLFALEDGMPFDHNSFITTIHCCLQACGIPPEGYSSHFFRRGAATWAATNGVGSTTIQGLGCWCSDCFWRYVDMLAAEHAATLASALYTNADQPLNLSRPAWCNF